MAQLYTKGKCYGIHPFIVQLRDDDTWMPMPGNEIKIKYLSVILASVASTGILGEYFN